MDTPAHEPRRPHPLAGRPTGPRPDIAAGLRAHHRTVRERGKETARLRAERLRLRPVLSRVTVLAQDAAGLDPGDLRALDAALARADGDRVGERDLGVLPGAVGPLRALVRAAEEFRADTGYQTRNRNALLR